MKKLLLLLVAAFSVNLSASEVPVNSEAHKNLITNGSFETVEAVPTSPDETSGSWFNVGIWEDDRKPKNWDYQKWQVDQPTENFHADILNDADIAGENAAQITVNVSNSSTQAFFKQTHIAIEGDRAYDLSFWSKLDNVVGRDIVLRVEEFDNSATKINSTDFTIGKGSSEWAQQEIELDTKPETKSVNLVFVIPSSTTGSLSIDDVYLGKKDTLLTDLSLDESALSLGTSSQKQLKVGYTPADTSQTEVTWSSTDESVASVSDDGLVTAVASGNAIIKVQSVANTKIFAECKVEVVDGDILVDKIELVDGDITMEAASKRFLKYKTYPSTAVNNDLPVTWSSSDTSVLTVDAANGLITAVSPGAATLTVASSEDASIKSSIEITIVADETDEEYNLMKNRWVKRIVGDDSLNLDNEYIAKYVAKTNEEAHDLWNQMDKSEDRTYLWPLKDGDTSSADITTQFKNIYKLTLAYGTSGSDLKENRELYFDIVDALEFMTTVKHYDGITVTSNWWDCQIGSAQKFTDILMIMSGYMPQEKVEEYATIIAGYAKDPSEQLGGYVTTGANRTDIGISVLGTGILLESEEKMELIGETIPDVFKLVTSGDGLYADGSVIQHGIYAYSGSYGNELMKGVGRILETIAGTKWDIKDESINNVYDTILNGYIPLMNAGRMMSMVSGRSVSRPPSSTSEFGSGASTIANMMVIASFAPEEYATIFKENVKGWIETETKTASYDFFKNARDLEALQNADAIMNDDSIKAQNTYTGTKVYSMDRAVQVASDYAIGLSMYSNRTGTYELQKQGSGAETKYENMQGWHQSDGVMYIYNDDYESYGDGYWATIDSKLLPGTTVSTSDLALGEGKGAKSDESWVGGASNGEIGAVGMQLDKATTGTDLVAKKSWFLLDGAVIALGSDIDGTSDDPIQTVVENRKIGTGAETKAKDRVVINGSENDGTEMTKNYPAGSWMNIKGTTDSSSIGYYFPQETNVTTLSETNTESFKSINTLFVDNKEYTDEYFKILVNHENDVENGSYAYYVLPGKTASDTAEFAADNSIEILRNDETVQGVIDREAKILAMNIWDPSGIRSDFISVDKPASLIIQINDDKLNITVSDPTREQSKIKVDLSNDVEILSMVEKDVNIGVSSDLHSLEYNSPADGSSSTVSFEIPVPLDFSELEAVIAEAEAIDQALYTPATVEVLKTELEAAKGILTSADTQQVIDDATVSLDAAIENLTLLADKTALEQLIKDAEQYQKGDYTKDSYSDFETALNKAGTILADPNVSQDDVDEGFDNLQRAIENLVKRNTTPGDSGETGDIGSETNPIIDDNDGNTSMSLENTGGMLYLMPVGLIIMAFLIVFKARFKNQ